MLGIVAVGMLYLILTLDEMGPRETLGYAIAWPLFALYSVLYWIYTLIEPCVLALAGWLGAQIGHKDGDDHGR